MFPSCPVASFTLALKNSPRSSLDFAKSRMYSNLDEFAYLASRVLDEETAQVDTRERWTYWWEDIRTARRTKEVTKASYTLRYTLLHKDDAWKVDEIEILESSSESEHEGRDGTYSDPIHMR